MGKRLKLTSGDAANTNQGIHLPIRGQVRMACFLILAHNAPTEGLGKRHNGGRFCCATTDMSAGVDTGEAAYGSAPTATPVVTALMPKGAGNRPAPDIGGISTTPARAGRSFAGEPVAGR